MPEQTMPAGSEPAVEGKGLDKPGEHDISACRDQRRMTDCL